MKDSIKFRQFLREFDRYRLLLANIIVADSTAQITEERERGGEIVSEMSESLCSSQVVCFLWHKVQFC